MVFVATHPSGGVRELWHNLASSLRSGGVPVELLGIYPTREKAADMAGWTLCLHRPPAGLRDWLSALRALIGWMRRARPAVIVTAMPAANVLFPVLARLFSPGTRVVTSHHSPTATHSRLLDRLDGLTGCLSSVEAIIAVSAAVARSLDGKPGAYRAKRKVITNALPPDIAALIDGMAPALPRRAPKGRRIAATGRLAYQKNYPMLIRAVALCEGVTLDIIGSGPDEAELRELVRDLGIADRVVFHGMKPREEALRLLGQCDLFSQVSRFEGHSLALLEAARFGLPLVVSDVPEQVEAVSLADGGWGGTIVPLDGEQALAAAFTRLFDTPGAYAEASEGALKVARAADFDALVAAYRRFAS